MTDTSSPTVTHVKVAADKWGTLAALLLVLVVTFLARLIPAIYLGVEVADLSMYREMALAVLRNEDIYDLAALFHYTPLSLFAPFLALRVSESTGLPFHLIMKVYPLAGDLGMAALIFSLAARRWGTWKGTWAGLGYAINPISIMTTAMHGQFMPLSVFFAYWAYYLLEVRERGDGAYTLSAFVLGFAIALRGWPVLLLPLLIRPGMLPRWWDRLVYIAVAALPSAVTLAPYMLVNWEGIQREIFNYTSVPDFGLGGISRNLSLIGIRTQLIPNHMVLMSRGRFYFLSAYALLVIAAYVRPYATDTAGWIIAALLLNYTLVGGLAAQYYCWVVPFLALRPRYGTAFTLVTSGALATFYLALYSSIILGPYSAPFAYTRDQMLAWNIGFLAATWLLGAAWVLWLITRIARSPRGAGSAVLGEAAAAAARPPLSRSRSEARVFLALGAIVLLSLAFELPFIARSRPAQELPAVVEWQRPKGGSDRGQFNEPQGVATDSSGNILVADHGNRRLERFDSTGNFLSIWESRDPAVPLLWADVAIGPQGEVYGLDNAGAIYRLMPDGATQLVVRLTDFGAYSPRGLAVDKVRRRFYVADTGRARLLVLGLDGALIGSWDRGADPRYRLDLAWGVGVDSQGNVFVSERGNSRIRKFSPTGQLLAEWMVQGLVADIAVGPDDRLYVCGSDRSRVWVYDDAGSLLGQVRSTLAAAHVAQTRAIAVRAPGEVVVATIDALARISITLENSPPPRVSVERAAGRTPAH
ncbi:MAG: SMP-30/gluconolactonase/LRE family protein [Acidobacteriia bacterium]|nr:SMP-30/gluconolactonase/LRE family protein [Terriglobia bacterium]